MKNAHYLLVLATLGLAGCSSAQRDPPLQVWTDMKHQARFRPQLSTEMYPDLQPMATSSTSSPTDAAPCRHINFKPRFPNAGTSSPMCACCNALRTAA